jgi:hypothetical protein
MEIKKWVKLIFIYSIGFEKFAFCNFPFILDSQSKSKILEVDSQIQQF